VPRKCRRLGCTAILFLYMSCAPWAMGQEISASSDSATSSMRGIETISVTSSTVTIEDSTDSSSQPSMLDQPRNLIPHKVAETSAWLRSKGLEFHLSSKTEASSNFHSGLSSNGTDERGLLETSASVDLQKAFGWTGGQLNISFHDYFGSNGTDRLMHDQQGYSNIDAYPANRIYELWFQQSLAETKVRFKLGRIDANTEFAYVENASEFLNSSMGFSPTILDIHTYPELRLGAVAAYRPTKFLSISTGVFRCMPSGSMVLGEIGTRWRVSRRVSIGRLAVGTWVHPHTLNGFDGRTGMGVHGDYVVAEQTLWKRASEIDDDSRGIRAFAQWGNADQWFSGVTRHLGTGFEWAGAFTRRPADVVGLGITTVRLGQDAGLDVGTGRDR
jgi:carbohydrate-selective porin OprB